MPPSGVIRGSGGITESTSLTIFTSPRIPPTNPPPPDHPSISDYYRAQGSTTRPLTYQHGLSNYSSVQLGDDRVFFKKSVSQDVYKLDTERQKAMHEGESMYVIPSGDILSKNYKEATELVGDEKINLMEQMMRDKLQQRTKTGPFQLRKTFKYFDRDGSGGIDFDEFQRAMELMGFQVSARL